MADSSDPRDLTDEDVERLSQRLGEEARLDIPFDATAAGAQIAAAIRSAHNPAEHHSRDVVTPLRPRRRALPLAAAAASLLIAGLVVVSALDSRDVEEASTADNATSETTAELQVDAGRSSEKAADDEGLLPSAEIVELGDLADTDELRTTVDRLEALPPSAAAPEAAAENAPIAGLDERATFSEESDANTDADTEGRLVHPVLAELERCDVRLDPDRTPVIYIATVDGTLAVVIGSGDRLRPPQLIDPASCTLEEL